MHYLDVIATEIQRRAGDLGEPLDLYRIYAVLALAKGPHTTDADVHHAWAAWRCATAPGHRHLIPFEALAPDVQRQDAPYTQAIRDTAREFGLIPEEAP